MDCKQVEKMLPLYVGRDLDARSDRLVTAHVESCTACSDAAGEYRQTRELLQEFAPPAFSEGVYAAIRQNVWRQIESESSLRSRCAVVIDLFRPRLAWALAAVVLLAVSVFGIYLISNRPSVPERIAVAPPAPNPDAGAKASRSPEEAGLIPPVTPHEAPKELIAGRRTPPRGTRRNVITNRADAVVVARSIPSFTSDTSSGVSLSTQSDASSESNAEKPLRMEIQTRNPNIRIIWFSQREQKHASSNSKGI